MSATAVAPQTVNLVSVGPAASAFTVHADESGSVAYHLDEHKKHHFNLTSEFSRAPLGVLAFHGAVAFFDLAEHRLLALGYVHHSGPLSFLVGERLGWVVDAEGHSWQTDDPLGEMLNLSLPFDIQHEPAQISLTVEVTYHTRETLHEGCCGLINRVEDVYHVELPYDATSGRLSRPRLVQVCSVTRDPLGAVPLEGFPVKWPAPPRKADPPPAAPKRQKPARVVRPRKGGEAPPSTIALADNDLIEVIEAEKDEERRWTMILENLRLKNPQRTYRLLIKFGREISAQTAHWATKTFYEHFHEQAGPMLVKLMSEYSVDRVFDVAGATADAAHVLEWLSEREVDRLMAVTEPKAPETVAAAEALLNVDPGADAHAIRLVWQQELQWLSAVDAHIPGHPLLTHRDDVVKALHAARDILLAAKER